MKSDRETFSIDFWSKVCYNGKITLDFSFLELNNQNQEIFRRWKMIHDFTMTGAIVLSVVLGWRHADEPFYDDQRVGMPRSLKWRAFWLLLIGAAVALLALLDPDVSKARETYHSMSTTGFKVFWLFLMGGLVVSYSVVQLVFHDIAARFHRFIKQRKHC